MIVYYILNVLMEDSIRFVIDCYRFCFFVDLLFQNIELIGYIQIWILMTDEHRYCYLIECLLQQCYDDDDDDNADYFIERGK